MSEQHGDLQNESARGTHFGDGVNVQEAANGLLL